MILDYIYIYDIVLYDIVLYDIVFYDIVLYDIVLYDIVLYDIVLYIYIYGWWFQPSEKYEFVSWDDDIPNIWKNKIHVPNHQPDIYIYIMQNMEVSLTYITRYYFSTIFLWFGYVWILISYWYHCGWETLFVAP